ncbi:hypothetical protein vseg_009968 [Gypsophila vaccaria]
MVEDIIAETSIEYPTFCFHSLEVDLGNEFVLQITLQSSGRR